MFSKFVNHVAAGLITFLMMHPDIRRKQGLSEPHFFNRDDVYMKGVTEYLNFMPYSEPGKITIEKTPDYFVAPNVPERIHRFNSSIRLLLIVRDPTKRLVSEYTHHAHHKR